MSDKMTDERLAEIRDQYLDYEVPASVMDALRGYADALGWVEELLDHIDHLESSKLLAASMMAEQFCGEQVERLRRQVATLRAERDAMTSKEGPTP